MLDLYGWREQIEFYLNFSSLLYSFGYENFIAPGKFVSSISQSGSKSRAYVGL